MYLKNVVYGLAGTRSWPHPLWRTFLVGLWLRLRWLRFDPRTCFWGGNTFTPKLKVKNEHGEEVSIQTFLQTTFLNMWAVLAKNVGDLPGVLGFEVRLCVSLHHFLADFGLR